MSRPVDPQVDDLQHNDIITRAANSVQNPMMKQNGERWRNSHQESLPHHMAGAAEDFPRQLEEHLRSI